MKHILLISVILISIFSCSQKSKKDYTGNTKIKSISISTYGGAMGYYQSLLITADSLFFNESFAVDSTKTRNLRKQNSHYKLEDFLSISQLAGFSKIPDGESNQPVDGTDTTIEIKTKQNKYAVTNADQNDIWLKTQMALDEVIRKEFRAE